MKKIWVVLVVLLTLPAFLFIFQPGWSLGGLGLLLGFIGNFVSPILILYLLLYFASREWKQPYSRKIGANFEGFGCKLILPM